MENTEEYTPKKDWSIMVRYALLGITLPSKPTRNHYATLGLENSKTLVLAYKKMHIFQ